MIPLAILTAEGMVFLPVDALVEDVSVFGLTSLCLRRENKLCTCLGLLLSCSLGLPSSHTP